MRKLFIGIISLLLSTPVFSCSMGVTLTFKEGLPGSYVLESEANRTIASLVKKYTQRDEWINADAAAFIKMPSVAENSYVVPVSIDMTEASNIDDVGQVVVLVEKSVAVLRTKGQEIEIPHRNRQVPINLKLNTVNAVTTEKVASYRFHDKTVNYLAMRVKLRGTQTARVFALLLPKDNAQAVKVISQKKATRVHGGCEHIIYVDGPMPTGAEQGYYYF